MPGKVYLIGAGPGDPGLFTLKGLRCLKEAQAVIYDHLASVSLLAYVNPAAELIYAGKEANAHTIPQNEINHLLVAKAQAGKVVARLKGGDPFVLGRGGEEALALTAADIAFEVVPGISAAMAGPMYAGIPVTHRGSSAAVTVLTGHEDPAKSAPGHNWRALAQSEGTLVFLMAMHNLNDITQALLFHGKDAQTPAAVIQNATTARQRTLITTLEKLPAEVAAQGFGPPALVVIGMVVKLGRELNWFEQKPLFGLKILLTRQEALALNMAENLSALGAECALLPTIEIKPLPQEPLQVALKIIDSYQWLVFTSHNAVSLFFETLHALEMDCRALHNLKIAVSGEVTAAELRKHGLLPDVVPEQFVSENLAESLLKHDIAAKQILLPRAKNAREILPQTLRKMGATVDVVPIYETLPATQPMRDWHWLNDMDMVTFTSASTVNALKSALPPDVFSALTTRATAACIGPITEAAAQKAGFSKTFSALTYTVEGLCQAITNHQHNKAHKGNAIYPKGL